jgi:hypothetical protein
MRKSYFILTFVFIGLFLTSASGEKLKNITTVEGGSIEAQKSKGTDEMLQFTSAEHVLGFREGEMFIASADHALRIEFVGSKSVFPEEEVTSQDVGNRGSKAAKPLGKISYNYLWDGVTLVYEKHGSGVVKSTYYIQPGGKSTASPVGQIRLRYNIPVKVEKSGSLLFTFETGQMKESRPVAWQEIKGKRIPVEASFHSLGEQEVGIKVDSYDSRFPLVIDPVLFWNTFMGSTNYDYGYGIAVDASGNVYVVGTSAATWGAPIIDHAGNYDAFVAKLNSSGVRQWNTFMGSADNDIGYGIAVDSSGNVYVTGYSNATWGTPVNDYAGNYDGFAAKLNSSGVRQWNTFMGSTSQDYGSAIAVDASGNVYVAGYSYDTWGTPVNDYAGNYDGFAAKLNSSGVRQWNTFMGSASQDYGRAIAVDASGNVYVAGYSDATWATPINDYAGNYDAFAVKLNSSGVRQWNTFIGSASRDYGYGIAVDTSGNVYVVGDSGGAVDSPCGSVSWISPSSAEWGLAEIANAGKGDAFAAKLNSSGVQQWQTLMGWSDYDIAYGVAVDTSGNVYVAGSSGAPIHSPSGLAPWISPSSATWGLAEIAGVTAAYAFAAKLNSSGVQQWYTFMGSSAGVDRAQGIAVDTNGYVHVAGYSSGTWETPVNGHAGNYDAFAAKLGEPEINIKYDDTDVPDGGSYDFGLHNAGTDTDITFTIENAGNADLILTTPISIGGADAGEFSVQQHPASPVAAGGSTTFVIRYSPTSGGTKTASLSIANDDSDENPYDIALTGDAQVVYSLTIAAGTGGTTDPSPGISSHNEGTQVDVTAIPDNGYRFDGWTGDAPSGHEDDNPLTVTMDSDKSITANFVREYTLTIAAGTGGTTDPVPGDYVYDEGTQVTVTATPEANYRFGSWSGEASGTDSTITITMDSDKSITANFIRQYTLTVAATAGGTTDPLPGTYTYDTGTQVTITATANANYRFTGWSGDTSGTNNPIAIIMDSDKSITANFIRQYTLILAAGPGGTTNPSPGTYIYDSGTQVTISCTPDANYRFSHWSGDASGATEPLTITMDSDKSITANFMRIIYAPSNFSGRKVVNRSLFLSEYLNALTWQANPANENIAGYRIYQVEGGSRSLLADVNASTFEYWHRRVQGGKQYTYILVAINNEGREGDPASVTVQ